MFIEDSTQIPPPNTKFLARLQPHEGNTHTDNFIISPVTQLAKQTLARDQFEKLWLVVKSLKRKSGSSGYQLAEGDVIRIGRCKFRVKEMSNFKGLVSDCFSLCDMLSGNEVEEDSQTVRNFILPCRICLSEGYEEENPLISPCKCGGTMKFIHLKCLQQCLMAKVTSKSSQSVLSFGWKKLCCDLCGKNYPYKLILADRTVELLEIPKPPGLYIVLEVLCKDKNSLKGLHVIHLGTNPSIKLGRAQECELRLNDISVSRTHAKLSFVAGNFFLEDTGSKFGTLIQVKRPILLDDRSEITMQSGRSLITYSLKVPWSLIPSCFRRTSSMFDTLQTRALPILPFNTGIPLSINDPLILLSFAGMPIKVPSTNRSQNLLHEHNHLGANSSYELSHEDSMESAEAVEIAVGDSFHGEETNRFESLENKP